MTNVKIKIIRRFISKPETHDKTKYFIGYLYEFIYLFNQKYS